MRQAVGATWLVVMLVGCGTQAGASRTTTTAGEYVPSSAALYVAKQELPEEGCSPERTALIEFATAAADVHADELVEIQKWATCLSRPELADTTVVLLGADAPDAPAGLYVRRAVRLRELFAERGVSPSRVVIGAPGAAREGGIGAPTGGIRLEITSSAAVRALDPPDPMLRYVR